MRECESCGNYIPDKMKLCPHCGALPPVLWPHFYVYALLTVIAAAAGVYFRPFGNGPVQGELSQGTLWVALVVFCVFFLIFLFVSIILLRDYNRRSYRGKLTKAERTRFINMKKHINSGRHFYDKELPYCTVCGHKKPANARIKYVDD